MPNNWENKYLKMPPNAFNGPSKDDILNALSLFFGAPNAPEKLADYTQVPSQPTLRRPTLRRATLRRATPRPTSRAAPAPRPRRPHTPAHCGDVRPPPARHRRRTQRRFCKKSEPAPAAPAPPAPAAPLTPRRAQYAFPDAYAGQSTALRDTMVNLIIQVPPCSPARRDRTVLLRIADVLHAFLAVSARLAHEPNASFYANRRVRCVKQTHFPQALAHCQTHHSMLSFFVCRTTVEWDELRFECVQKSTQSRVPQPGYPHARPDHLPARVSQRPPDAARALWYARIANSNTVHYHNSPPHGLHGSLRRMERCSRFG